MDEPKELTEEERRQAWLAAIVAAEPEDGAFAGDPNYEEPEAEPNA